MTRRLTGATQWARKTLDSDIFANKPAEWFKIWFCLVQLANYKDEEKFKRGDLLITYAEIMLWTKTTKNQVDGFVRWAKSTGIEHAMITTRKTTRGFYVSLLNYDKYQTLNNYKTDTGIVNKPSQNRQDNKEVKNINNIKKVNSEGELTLSPSQNTKDFFLNLELQEQTIRNLVENGINEQAARIEIAKFVNYWTELNHSGTKQRWQLERTFEIPRRLATWFRNNRNFNKQAETKGITL